MARELTKKQRGFVKDYLDTGNGTLAVKENYKVANDNVAANIASMNLRKAKIQESIQNHAEDAESMVYKLSQTSKQDFIKLNASKDILDRAGYGAIAKSESKALQVNLTGQILANTELEALRKEYEEKLKARLLEDNKPQWNTEMGALVTWLLTRWRTRSVE